MFDINCNYELDDSRMVGVMDEGFEKVEAALRERNELLATKITVPLEAYKDFTLHAGAMEDIMAVWDGLNAQRGIQYEKAVRHWELYDTAGWGCNLCLYFEIRHIMEAIEASLKDAPFFSETVQNMPPGASTLELRGEQAKRYLSQKCVILHIDDLMELVGRCKHPGYDLRKILEERQLYRRLFHETPAKKAGPLKFMEVQYDHSCLIPEESIYGRVDGEEERRSLRDEVDRILSRLPHYQLW